MTYQSPGLRRSSFLSATAGSSSSSSGVAASSAVASAGTSSMSVVSSTASVSVVSSTASAAELSSRRSAASSAITVAGSAASASASETAEGDSPSKEVTCQSSLNCSSAEYQHHELGEAQVDQADQRHHERQKDQHHGGVVDHLLAVRPDHLAQLGDDLLQVVPDEGERVARRPVGDLLGGLDLDAGTVLGGSGLGPGRQVDGLAGILIDRAAPRPLACLARRAGHHRGLTAGVTGAVGNAVGYGAVACGAGTIALVAHRMPFVWFLWVTFQCPHLSSIQLSRGDRT